ncbi:MAG: hypothetical protein KGV50_03345 [Gammaproteobacteria bacterium]|nr:hypothetical protein [Gammaproteobacteria bacterium]
MDKQLQTLQQELETISQRSDDAGIEFWFARELQTKLGYARHENDRFRKSLPSNPLNYPKTANSSL